MIKIHGKFGNFFIFENDTTIAMCTQSKHAKRIKKALDEQDKTNKKWDRKCYIDSCGMRKGLCDLFEPCDKWVSHRNKMK